VAPPLSWIDVVWLMGAGACLTLALVHGGSWLRERTRWADLHFAVAAVGVFGVALVETFEMRAQTAQQFLAIHYWIVFALLFAGLGLAGFVQTFFGTGRPWLLWLTVALRVAVAIVHLFLPHGINYGDVPEILRLELAGGAVATVALGLHTHWTHLDELAWTVAILFTMDAARTAWRKGAPEERARIARVAGAILFVYLIGVPLSALVHAGLVRSPYFVTPLFLVMLGAMGNELANDRVRLVRVRSELVTSETRRRASEQDLELAAEAAGLSLGWFDPESGEITTTPRGREVFGFAPDERMVLDDLLARVHPEDRERVRAALARAVAEGGSYEEIYRMAVPGGGWRWLASRGRVGFDEGGSRPRLRGVTFEITARRQAEERFRRVFEAAQSGLLIVGGDGKVKLANARAEADFGYGSGELAGVEVDLLLPERLRAGHAERRAAYLREPETRSMGPGRTLLARRRDGSEFPVEIGLSPLPGPGASEVLAAVVDVSERTEAELAAARQRSELAHLSRVAVLGELSASLAHELNQPLAAILSNAQAAQRFLDREEVDLEQLREIVGDIVEDDKRAGEVIRRLRAMLRKEELAHEPLDVDEVVRDVLQIMNSDFINRGVQVETRLEPELPPVAGDRVQLQQVLLNLLMNGCDAISSLPRPRRLTVATRVGDGERVEIEISDSGPGIPTADLERVFEPFVTSKEHGTGLGLAVCRTIVTAHRGRIWAANNEGRGATITVALPAADSSRLA
jgi:two-component system sensor kinase FixL